MNKSTSFFIACFIWKIAVTHAQAPQQLTAQAFERHIELTWKAGSTNTNQHYEIWASDDGGIEFKKIATLPGFHFFYLDWLDAPPPVVRQYKVRAIDVNQVVSPFSDVATAQIFEMTDDELLEMVQRATFRYFWEHAHPVSGMARERTGSGNTVTTGGTGFGIMAMVVAAERGWVSRSEVVDRLLRIVSFLQVADRFHGVFPHWIDGNTGNTIPFSQYDDGADLVETAFLIQGLLTARQYFNGSNAKENALRQAITQIWEEVEWNFFRKNNSSLLFWHWSPNYGWHMNHGLRGFNETHICYLLAVASPTHPVPASLYHTGWAGGAYANTGSHYGYPIYCGPWGGGPLFFAHYSYLGFDPRHRKDQFCNYFTRNRHHALIQQAYAIHNPKKHKGYSAQCWGLTASDNPWGYHAHDIQSPNDNGTIAPTAALASMPYSPAESMAALKYFYRELGKNLWSEQGFYDAFNLNQNWFARSHLAIDQGPIIAMIENYRTGLLWNMFMKNPEIQPALDAIGFVPDVIAADDVSAPKPSLTVAPNPAASGETLQLLLSGLPTGDDLVRRIRVVHSSGKVFRVMDFADAPVSLPDWSTRDWSAGFYIIQVELSSGKQLTTRVVIL